MARQQNSAGKMCGKGCCYNKWVGNGHGGKMEKNDATAEGVEKRSEEARQKK